MHKFAVDGLTIEVSDANAQTIVEKAIGTQRERADAAEKALAEAKKQAADLATKVEVYEAKLKEHADSDDKFQAALAEGVKKLAALGAEVAKHGVDVSKLDASEVAYHTAALAKLSPKFKTDGKDAGQIKTAYELAVSMAAEAPSAVAQARAGVNDSAPRADGPSSSADEARRKYNERLFGQAK